MEKYENLQWGVKSSEHPRQLLIEQGIEIKPSGQKVPVKEPMASGSGKQFLYVELWTPKQDWLDLSQEERQEYFSKVGGEIQKLTNEGIKVLGFAVNDQETPHHSDHQYVAVWQMPSKKHVEMLEESVYQAGWYDYFEQVNACGELISPPVALEDMVRLK